MDLWERRSVSLNPFPWPVRTSYFDVTESSNNCDTHGSDSSESDPRIGDRRNCVGYAISRRSIGEQQTDGKHSRPRSVTPPITRPDHNLWLLRRSARSQPMSMTARDQVGADSSIPAATTRRLPAMVPVSMLYGNSEASAINDT